MNYPAKISGQLRVVNPEREVGTICTIGAIYTIK
jgi:hypothetical protein